MTPFSIRLATTDDIAQMHRVRVSVLENRLSNPALVRPDDYRSMLVQHGRGWVCEVDGRIVGFAIGDLSRSNIWALFVEPEFERRGIGRRLHDAMLEWMFAAGARNVWLGTQKGSRAEGFYRAAGWRGAGDQPNGEVRYEMSRDEWLIARTS
jgi:GNAT superfamily N-acetyltransferase